MLDYILAEAMIGISNGPSFTIGDHARRIQQAYGQTIDYKRNGNLSFLYSLDHPNMVWK